MRVTSETRWSRIVSALLVQRIMAFRAAGPSGTVKRGYEMYMFFPARDPEAMSVSGKFGQVQFQTLSGQIG